MNATTNKRSGRELTAISEYSIGTEDRVFSASIGGTEEWFWQARGSDDCFGPFSTREDAETDYDRTA